MLLAGLAIAAEWRRSTNNEITVDPGWVSYDEGAAQIRDSDFWRDMERERYERMALRVANARAQAFRNSLDWAQKAITQKWVNDANLAQWIVDATYAATVPVYQRPRSGSPRGSYAGSGYCSIDFLEQFGFENPGYASAVCMCESGGNPNAVSPSGRHLGIFQLDSGHRNAGGGTSPESQAAYVARYTNANGWGPWECA